jgi:hypothetical protein|tara:strand:+ start:5101 stop:5550 length:450 start_codon:yes stop_codon:yes gene_type:complete
MTYSQDFSKAENIDKQVAPGAMGQPHQPGRKRIRSRRQWWHEPIEMLLNGEEVSVTAEQMLERFVQHLRSQSQPEDENHQLLITACDNMLRRASGAEESREKTKPEEELSPETYARFKHLKGMLLAARDEKNKHRKVPDASRQASTEIY